MTAVTAVLMAGIALTSTAAGTKADSHGKKKPPAKTVTIAKGDDGWKTPGGGRTQIDLAGFPVEKIFGAPLTGSAKVSLKGRPLSTELGDIDTIIRRPEDIVLKAGSGSGPLEIAAISLESEKPVSIGGKNYQLRVGLSDTAEARPGHIQKPGHISLTMTHGDGGTLSSSLPVQPRLVFTPEGGGQPITIDCGAVPACADGGKAFVLTGKNTPWAITGGPRNFTDDAAGIRPIKAGVTVGGEGFRSYTTIGSSNLVAGVRLNSTGAQVTAARVGTSETSLLMAHNALPL
jgi:hypothetical protein